MKKQVKLLNSIVGISTFCVLPTMTTLTSCGFKYGQLVNQLYDETINQFIGEDGKHGICQFPHFGKYDENKEMYDSGIIPYIKQVASDANAINIDQDKGGNVWYDIPPSIGCENWKPLVLQSHIDMVWDVKDGYETDDPHPIPVYEKDKKIIHTKDYSSSLGADDGAGVSTMLAITKQHRTFNHGPIRMIYTNGEELGQIGASLLGQKDDGSKVNVLEGFDYLLNLDAEKLGQTFVSCAGGYSANYNIKQIPTGFINKYNSSKEKLFVIDVTGGAGGHSGMVMIDNPINAALLAIKLGFQIYTKFAEYDHDTFKLGHVKLVDIQSFQDIGNAVPSKAQVILSIEDDQTEDKILSILQDLAVKLLKPEKAHHPREKNINITVSKYSNVYKDISYEGKPEINADMTRSFFKLLSQLKFGADQIDEEEHRLVSSANVAPIELHLTDSFIKERKEKEEKLGINQFNFMIFDRSDSKEYLQVEYIDFTSDIFIDFLTKMGNIQDKGWWSIEKISQYPPFVYNPDDKVHDVIANSFKKQHIKSSDEKTHGGIECGWWYDYNNNINETSIGPTIDDVHNHKEILHTDTIKPVIQATIDLIDAMKSI